MSSDEILYNVADGIATITLNRPHVMNAFVGTMREDLLTRLDDAAADSQVRCVVITGAGKAFCAGGDIANMADLQGRGDTQVIGQRMQVAADIVRLLRALSASAHVSEIGSIAAG